MRVFVTGGAGFLGRALMRYWTEPEYVVYSHGERSQALCRQKYPHAKYILGDICDVDHLTEAMRGAEVVVHAAAMKSVPDCERDAREAIRINVEGSAEVAAAAIKVGARMAVAVSTDKAVEPNSAYGATKMLMERLWLDRARYWGDLTAFSLVRMGNLIGSDGSVVPLWRKQIELDGRVLVTDASMTRFWLGPREAAALIRRVVSEGPAGNGSIFLSRFAGASLEDVARAVFKESEPEIQQTGARPGERQHERFFTQEESTRVLGNVLYSFPLEHGERRMISSNCPPVRLSVDDIRVLIDEADRV